jgi:hypothetical protein
MPLTKFDVQALRKCNRLCLHYYEGKSYIRAIKSADPEVPFSEDREVRIDCDHREHVYGKDGSGGYKWRLKSAFHHDSWPQDLDTMRAVIDLVRPGDELILEWTAGGLSNQYVTNAGLNGDSVHVIIVRGGKRKYRLLIGTGTCPDNTARMCQVEPRPEYAET